VAVSTINKESEGDTGWIVYRPEWYNERIMETYISSPVIDKQNDKIPTDTIKEAMDFYMKYGVYSYRHEEQPIGLPLAYKVKDKKVKIRVGIHDKLSMHNKIWDEIKEFGSKGASSIRGEAMDQEKVCDEESCHNQINELDLWSVSWVGDSPANPDATVREVAMAKTKSDTIQVTLDEIEGMVEKIIERRGKEYCLLGKKDRKVLGCHDTKAGAIRQERAIQARRYSKSNEMLDDILKTMKKSCTPRVIKTDSLKKSNDLLDDVMRMIKFGTFIEKKKTPGAVWFNNCRMNAMKIERLPGRKQIRDKRAFCSELWYNPGRFDQTYKKPDGSTGKTSGMQFRLDMGTSSGPSGLHGR
jgi:hypothetical protein